MGLTDESIYRRALNGDEAALADLITRYHAPLLRFLQRLTNDRMLAEDLLQETFTRLITYRGAPPQNFRTWVYTIARNAGRDAFKRAEHKYTESESFDDWDERTAGIATSTPSAEEAVTERLQRSEMSALLQRLSPAAREVLILRFYHDLSLDEISTVIDAPLGTVKSRLFNALKHLKALIGPEERL